MNHKKSYREVEDSLQHYQEGTLDNREELEFRIEIQRFPELAKKLAAWDLSVEADILATPNISKSSRDRRKKVLKGWDQIDKELQEPGHFPIFHPASTAADLLNLIPDAVLNPTEPFQNVLVQKLDRTEDATTLIIHLKDKLPEETHTNLIEQFVILQGNCIVNMNGNEITLEAGNYFRIPLLHPHSVKVTSAEPCIFLCQRIPA